MCDGKQKYEDYKVDAVVSPQGAKSPAKRNAGREEALIPTLAAEISANSPVDCFFVGR